MAQDPKDVALEYFSRVRAKRADLAKLFHEDARLLGLGARVSGRDAIRAFYAGAIEGAGPTPSEPVSLVSDGGRAIAEILIRLNDGSTIHAIDVFEVEGGLIRTLTYFIADYPDAEEPDGGV